MVLVLHIDIVGVMVRWSIVDDAVFIAKWEYICFMRHMILWVGLALLQLPNGLLFGIHDHEYEERYFIGTIL